MDVSIGDLLHHTGGLPDYMELLEKTWDKTKSTTNQDIVEAFAKYKPKAVFQPGEKYEYCNTGYALLALIIESLSEESYGQFLAKNTFQPLAMKNIFVHRSR